MGPLLKYVVDQVLLVSIVTFISCSFYWPAHPLVIFFNSASTSWNDSFSGTRGKQLCKSRTIKQTDSVVCLFHLSIARYLWRNTTQLKMHSELCSALLLSFWACKCQCDIGYRHNDSVVVFSLHVKSSKMFSCEISDSKMLCCRGDWLFLNLGSVKILEVFPLEHSNGSSLCCHLCKLYSQALISWVVVSAGLQCWNFK